MADLQSWARSNAARLGVATCLLLGTLTLWANQADASPALTVTPLTWNVIGLDSNDVEDGPNEFPVGARVCNTGDAPAEELVTTMTFTSANAFVNLVGPSSHNDDTLDNGACTDVYFTVRVTRDDDAHDTTRAFVITASADGVSPVSTPTPRELYVEKLISQHRNEIESVDGPATVYVGDVIEFTLDGSTAPGGYEQLEAFLAFDPSIFRVRSVTATYTAPSGGTNDKPYADACGFDVVPTSDDYRDCIGPELYDDGKAGGTVISTYEVEVVGAGTSNVGAVIYDFSGSSFHYNPDFDSTARSVAALPAADLWVLSEHDDPFSRGAAEEYTWIVGNEGPSAAAGPVTVTSTLPAGLTYTGYSATGGATCAAVGQLVTCTFAGGLAVDALEEITIDVDVALDAAANFTPSVTVASTTHDPDAADNTALDPTTTNAPPTTTTSTTEVPTTTTSTTTAPTTTTTSTTLAPTTTTTAAPTTTTSTTVAPPTTTTTTTTTSTTAPPTTTSTTVIVAPTTTTSTTVRPTTTTTVRPTTSTTVRPTTTTTVRPTTTTTVRPTTTTTTTAALPIVDDALTFLINTGSKPGPVVQTDDGVATFTVVGGSLPPGLSLLSDGTFTGTATHNGTYEFDASVCTPTDGCSVRHVRVEVLNATAAAPLNTDAMPRTGTNTAIFVAIACLAIAIGELLRTFSQKNPTAVR